VAYSLQGSINPQDPLAGFVSLSTVGYINDLGQIAISGTDLRSHHARHSEEGLQRRCVRWSFTRSTVLSGRDLVPL
jgi:hypothetical protein